MAKRTIIGLPELEEKLRKLENPQEIVAPQMVKAVAKVQDYISKAPKKAPFAFTNYATDKQRRAYWARVRRGEIDHDPNSGYVRTNTLQKGWETEVKIGPGKKVTGILSNNVSYVRYVHDTDKQQLFHMFSGWRDTAKVRLFVRKEIMGMFKSAIDKELRK